MDFSVASSSWIYAYKTGPALKSDDANARLQQHDGYGHLTFSFTDAAISADEQGNFTFVDGPAAPELPRSLLLMHALGAVAVVLVVFPVGLLTLASRRRPFGHSLHVAIQLLGVAVFVAAAGVGIYIARVKQQVRDT